MPRPATKQELMTAANEQFTRLWKLIDSMPHEKQQAAFSFEDRDRNLRDVLVHLYEWHMLLLKWVRANRAGNAAGFLPEPYNWKTYPQMNVKFWEKHQGTPPDEAVKLLKASHGEVMALIDTFTDEELFAKKHFSWTGTTSLGSYAVSSTSSHYDWAIKKLTKHIKN